MANESKKGIRIILYLLLLVLVGVIIFFIFKSEISNEKVKNNETKVELVTDNDNTVLPTPDRIIYKNKNNEYMIIDSEKNVYTKIYSELYNRIDDIIEGKVYSEDEIAEMQNRGSFIEFDYNSKSKNFVFLLEEQNIGIIKRFSDSGQVIQTSLSNIDELVKEINNLTKDNTTKYDFNTEYSFNSENKLSRITDDLNLSQVKVSGVYQKIINYDENEYHELLEKLDFKIEQELPKVDFNKQSVVITASHYEIKEIKKNIGNIKYEFGKFLDEYIVNIFIVSKVVNTNCIYYSTDSNDSDISEFAINDNNGLVYYVEDGKYYTTINHTKTEIISIEKAADIAELEAKDEKYQYQGWESKFYCIYDEDEPVSGELILGLDDISRLYDWRNEWQKEGYEEKLMWKIRLFDENDPLTSLYIYIDAINGNIIGAGASSD